ncbi:MAG: hypothetical protein ACRDQ4_04715 [Pseudonocardiaceae bacterium]
MTNDGKTGRVRYQNVIRKIIITIATGGLAYLIIRYFIANPTDQPQILVRIVSVFIAGITLLVQFLRDFEKRLESVEEKQETHSTETQSMIKEGFSQTSKVMELFQALEKSALQTDTVTQLVQHATQIKPDSPSLVYRFAQSQISQMSQLLKDLSEGGDVSYDGEDQDWMLGLTMQSQHAIDATSMSTVDAGGISFEGGLWTSALGQRYLEFQREAIHRGVIIRRVFILDGPGQTREPEFLRIYQQQQDLGIRTKVLDRSTIPPTLRNILFDFIVFDGVISYEVTPAARVEDSMKPTIVKTNLALQSQRVRERMQRFEKLWDAAKPD